MPLDCSEYGWHWASQDESTLVTLPSRMAATGELKQVGALVRATNGVGGTTLAASPFAGLDASPPEVWKLYVDGAESGGGDPCVLNRTVGRPSKPQHTHERLATQAYAPTSTAGRRGCS